MGSEGNIKLVFDVVLCAVGADFDFVGSWWNLSEKMHPEFKMIFHEKVSLAFGSRLEAIKERRGGKEDSWEGSNWSICVQFGR